MELRCATMAAMRSFPVAGANNGRVVWKVISGTYPYELSDDFYTAPIYVNSRKVTKQTRNIVESLPRYPLGRTAIRWSTEWRTPQRLIHYIRDHLDRLMACRNPSSPFVVLLQ